MSGALLAGGWVDELIVYMAPRLLGDGARALFRLPQWESLADTVELDIDEMRAVGADWRIMARVRLQQA